MDRIYHCKGNEVLSTPSSCHLFGIFWVCDSGNNFDFFPLLKLGVWRPYRYLLCIPLDLALWPRIP